ncbi:hypothetical protein ES288_D05G208200v1 [Gossypium darwinii]|uniref:Uncharacterized protein n=1 Tax=Gossypium darwinii TaxID=34276 RepID=A0A5D2CK29_GOSDA|nr:hypothetical protein ES288_D05G208200v1 [Gossypium darwinii]
MTNLKERVEVTSFWRQNKAERVFVFKLVNERQGQKCFWLIISIFNLYSPQKTFFPLVLWLYPFFFTFPLSKFFLLVPCSSSAGGNICYYGLLSSFPYLFFFHKLHILLYGLLEAINRVIQSWRSPTVIYFLVIQLLVLVVALLDIHGNRFSLVPWRYTCWGHFLTFVEQLGSHLKVASCLLLPAIQLVVGISHPSWISLPFFIGSCIGLVDWSLASNFLGLFRRLSSFMQASAFSCFMCINSL